MKSIAVLQVTVKEAKFSSLSIRIRPLTKWCEKRIFNATLQVIDTRHVGHEAKCFVRLLLDLSENEGANLRNCIHKLKTANCQWVDVELLKS